MLQTHRIDFGLTDARGRAIGVHITSSDTCCFQGLPFGFRPQAIRNGLKYGRVQPWRYFRTAEEANAAFAKYVKGARARASKLARDAEALKSRDLTKAGLRQPEGMARGLPNCGVVSVATCAGVPYQQAWDVIRGLRQRGGGWKGRTFQWERLRALELLNVPYRDVFSPTRAGRLTLRKWAQCYAKRGVTYMVGITGHSVTFRDGVILDQAGLHSVDTSPLGRKVMIEAFEINPA